MQKMTVRGIPLHVDSRRIVAQDGDAIVTYSRDYYRLPHEPERRITREPIAIVWTDPLPVRLEIGPEGHGFLRPIYEGR